MKEKTSPNDRWVNARRPIEPTVTKTPDSPIAESVETHPAYGLISAGRAQGPGAYLFGSDFQHRNVVVIRISHAEKSRGLNRDWIHGREEIIEVELSEAQWATFVSTFNGGGVPCTLSHVERKPIPHITRPQRRTEQFKGEAVERLEHARKMLVDLQAHVAAGKGGKYALGLIETIGREIGENLTFTADQFGEHMEDVVEAAKIEVEAYANAVITRAGLDTLGAKAPVALDAHEEAVEKCDDCGHPQADHDALGKCGTCLVAGGNCGSDDEEEKGEPCPTCGSIWWCGHER